MAAIHALGMPSTIIDAIVFNTNSRPVQQSISNEIVLKEIRKKYFNENGLQNNNNNNNNHSTEASFFL